MSPGAEFISAVFLELIHIGAVPVRLIGFRRKPLVRKICPRGNIGRTPEIGRVLVVIACVNSLVTVQDHVPVIPVGIIDRLIDFHRINIPAVVRIGLKPQDPLFQIIQTVGRLAGFLNLPQCRQKHAREYGDDGDDHQQFDQRESLQEDMEFIPVIRTSHDYSPFRFFVFMTVAFSACLFSVFLRMLPRMQIL